MIELPDEPAPNGVEVTPIDFGFNLRPSTGATILRVNRMGTRFQVAASYPPMTPDTARKFRPRLLTAKREGLRIEFPLLGLSQGSPGSPVVDGSITSATRTLPLKGLTPGYALKEGYAMTLIDGDGLRYLHFAASAGMADASGDLTITVEPPIRAPLPNGATVLLAKPTVEGVLLENPSTQYSVDRLVRFGGTVTIEESAGRAPDIEPNFDSTNPSFTFDSDED